MQRKILKKYSSKIYWKNKTVLNNRSKWFYWFKLIKTISIIRMQIVIGITNDKNKNSLIRVL